jgi:hypothetical protein
VFAVTLDGAKVLLRPRVVPGGESRLALLKYASGFKAVSDHTLNLEFSE